MSEQVLRALAETLGQHQWMIQMLVKKLEESGAIVKGEFRTLFEAAHEPRVAFGRAYAQTLLDSEDRQKTDPD